MAQTKVQLLQPDLGDVIDFDSSTLFMDGSDNRVGIRNTNPQYELDVTGTVNATNFRGNISTGTIDDWITHAGDTNTKLGFPANDQFSVETGGSQRLLVQDAGAKVTGTLELTDALYWDGDTDTTIDNAAGTANWIRFKTGGTTVMDITSGHDLKLHDNRRLRVGASDDIQIFHNSGNDRNYFFSPQNNVYHEFNVANSWTVQTTAGDKRIECPANGTSTAVELYHNGSKKLETTSLGARVVGDLQMGNTVGVRFHHTGTTSIFETQTAGDDLLFKTTPSGGSTTGRLKIKSGGSVNIGGDYDQTSKKFKVTGNSTFDGGLHVTGLLEGGSGFSIINGNLTLPAYTYHDADADTYYGFSGADEFSVFTGGAQRWRIQSDGNMRWFPDGSNGVNLYATSGTSSIVLAANKNGSTGTTWHFKNQNSSGQAKTWMEVGADQRISMPYGMGGTNILNVYNTTGRDGINIFANVNSGNQNSDAGVINFNGYAQTNGAWIQATNELAYAKKDLLFGTSYGNGNNYDTRDWDKPVQRLTYGGWVGMKEAASTNASVDSLLHIAGNSDNGDQDCQLTIEDTDSTSGSRVPSIQFKGNGANTWRIRGTDLSGLQLSSWNGSAQVTRAIIGNPDEGGAFLLYADDRGWGTFRWTNNTGMRTHVKVLHSPGDFVQTYTILRIRRHNWGWGHYKIRCKEIYYTGSYETTYYVNGHGVNGDYYHIHKETYGGDASSNDWPACTITETASSSSPGSSGTWMTDVKINVPNYRYAIVYIEAWGAGYSTDPTSMNTNSYCLM